MKINANGKLNNPLEELHAPSKVMQLKLRGNHIIPRAMWRRPDLCSPGIFYKNSYFYFYPTKFAISTKLVSMKGGYCSALHCEL